ncbi:hypothetical protein H310_03983 [Aphanomyces invadans]|uniref:non-specific serine/threonine protein kinase n=1 Tax=Aphanomyces invadans TaxID=157072 RepID=A0A024UGW5_9STRA|nr:hypothetical protein H310_03983 [Aphanomyces invadans]ETW04863.1 hypothetical protein H310_03983 [Aphanomyces invadans]|eukprot:XP_008866301.1 hypothetical protein H310_03983 [Aphanomyces invadans]
MTKASRSSSSVVAIAATLSTTASLLWLYTTTPVGTHNTNDDLDYPRHRDLSCPEVTAHITSDWYAGSRIALKLSHSVDDASLELHTTNWAKVSSGYMLHVEPMSLDSTAFLANTLGSASTYDLVVDKQKWNAPVGVTAVRVHLPSQSCSYAVTPPSRSSFDGRILAEANDTKSIANSSLAPLPCSWTQARPFSIGFNHLCAINPLNAMSCWGLNSFGQATVSPATSFVQVSAYDYHTCAINATGFPMCWGANYTARANAPGSVVTPPVEPFASISAGALHACGITITGALRCWGANDFNQSSPPAGQYLSVSTGFRHACAVSFPDQRLACWGNCDNGECDPPNATAKYTQVSAGDRYTCAVTVANNASCWGRDLPTMNYTVVPPGQYSFVGTARAGAFSCGLLLNGSAVCWGDRIAYMGLTPSVNFTRLALGTRQVCGVTAINPVSSTGGNLLCYGVLSSMAPAVGFRPKSTGYCIRNTSTLDDSLQTTADSDAFNATFSNATWSGGDVITFPPPPEDDLGAGLNLTSYQFRKVAAAGNKFSCGVASTGQAVCWGSTNLGGAASTITNAVDITASLVYDLMCALRVTGSVTCSSLAIDTTGNFISGAFAAPRDAFVMVSSKGMHTCSLKTTGRIKCWGFNDDRQLNVPDLTYLYVAAGGFHTCAITSRYETLCWGRDSVGQVSRVPVGIKHRFVSCGHQFCCAIRLNDMVDCWGSNDFGESRPPTNVPVLQIAAGWAHTCAVTVTWGLRCWGDNSLGQAVPPAGMFYHVSAGTTHSCATAVNGSVVCWGDVVRNQLTPTAAMALPNTALTTDEMVEATHRNNSRSRMTCSNLSWGIAYSSNLCANPKTFSGCVPPSTYAGAVARCRDLGGRVPTVAESRAGWLKAALCDFSDGWTWTSTTCLMTSGQSGFIIVSDSTQAQSCVLDTMSTAFPICISEREFTSCSLSSRCSQVCVGQAESQYACTCDAGFTLGSDGMSCFPTVLLRSASTCKQLNRPMLSSSPICSLSTGCTHRMTYADARTYCRARGTRLPLRQEVVGKADFPFACARDVAIWTNTACANGFNPGFIATTGESEACRATTELATVVCVADPDIDECELGMHTCTEKCWNTEGSYTCTCDDARTLVAVATGGATCQQPPSSADNTMEAITSAQGDTVVAPATPPRQATSARSCRQLQWTDLQTDRAICSSSRTTPGNPPCPGAVNYTVALQYCANRGARLPLLSELRSSLDVLVRSNECGYGQQLVWTSTSCSRDQQPTIGVAAAGGGPQLLDKVMCLTTSTQTAFPVCVADKMVVGSCAAVGNAMCSEGCVDLADGFRCECGPSQRLDADGVTCTNVPPTTSPFACDGIPLPWTFSDQNNATVPCARSFGTTPSACSGRLTFAQAQTWCGSLGGRLPTASEVAADVTLGSGCKYDYSEVWTSTPCFDSTGQVQGAVTSGGSSIGLSFAPPSCSSRSSALSTAFVRCVRDRGATTSRRCTPNSCSQLCINQGFGYACTCYDGFRLQPDGKTCSPAQLAPPSTGTCTRLNWNTVSANSTCAKIEGNCAGKARVPMALANASCTQQGARLPTLAEVMQGATIASTCGETRIWTSTRCMFVQDGLSEPAMTDGWITVTSSRKHPVCVPANASYTPACIADATPLPICLDKCFQDQQCLVVAGTNVTSCVCNPGLAIDSTGACQPSISALSTATCSDLSWGVDSKSGLCASQRLGAIAPDWIASYLQLLSKSVQNGLRLCLPPSSWTAAAAQCDAQSSRLPTLFEIRAGLWSAYSCSTFSGQRVWTSTPCRNSTTGAMGYIATGLSSSSWGVNKEICLSPASSFAMVQCAADSAVDPCTAGMHTCAHMCISQGGAFACACNDGFRLGENGSCSPAVSVRTPATCAGLQWPRRAGMSICTSGLVARVLYDGNGTEVVNPSLPYVREVWTCSGAVTYDAAVALCDNLRARLPTMSELFSNSVASAGCADNVDVWTQTTCRPSGGGDRNAVHRVKGAGATSLLHAFPRSCVATTAVSGTSPVLAHVRCVANV